MNITNNSFSKLKMVPYESEKKYSAVFYTENDNNNSGVAEAINKFAL